MTNHEKHILLWDELAKTGSYEKEDIFDELFPDCDNLIAAAQSCWACAEAGDVCDCCPIDWGPDGFGDTSQHCTNPVSPFRRWLDTDDPETTKRLAAQIRDLPWRKK